MRVVVWLCVCFVFAFSGEDDNRSWIDSKHKELSRQVFLFSGHLDRYLDEKLTDYSSLLDENRSDDKVVEDEQSVGEWFSNFFRDEEFDDSYKSSYLRVRTGVEYNYQESDYDPFFRVRLSLALPKTQNRAYLFIDGAEDDTDSRNFNSKNKRSLGLRLAFRDREYLKSYYSAGLHGVDDPYVKAKYTVPYAKDDWYLRVEQKLEYSKDDEFEEETNLYFDKRLFDRYDFLRYQIGRRSETFMDGMEYYGGVSFHRTAKYDRGLQVGFSVLGNTDSEDNIDKYSLYGVWKKNFYRKWLYYEIEPRVEWENIYDFDANYIVVLSLEIYFGGDM